ncbi:pyridoxamine 5'-phosphate oxidase family protein [Mycolicibacterium smegmatis]|uniref:Pyridoxamine 5'-phosphate oxidase n=1 Tax=Mycolicibacterium smegmatis (strain MKD8) TaxID=1214915 RepID=A0A2U9Q0Q2_MYCSE|nr:pyridoxamine 5'-phosphate oxidase family protein [Mycolicibacterium smegmatis]AWT57651.1 Pyridoxamine 5'-phosphate oxidase [Mycolicibacterium smegmatis MKD8]
MGMHYHHLIFGPQTLARQNASGSIVAYGGDLDSADQGPQALGDREIHLLVNCFQFHMATLSPTGWPYIQYRSGPRGFLHHVGERTIGFADHQGNQQYVTVGNIEANGKVALFVADMPVRARLKLFGTARIVEADEDPDLLQRLRSLPNGLQVGAKCERSILIDVEAYDWNCRRSLVPQYTEEQVRARMQPYLDEITALRAEVDRLRADR